MRFSDSAHPFDLILDVSHDVGDVIYVSEEEGLVQVLIDAGKRTESILLAQIDNSVLPSKYCSHLSCNLVTSH